MRSRAPVGVLALTFTFLLIGLLVRRWEIMSLVIPLLFYFYFGTWLHRKPIIVLKVGRELEAMNAFEGDELNVVVRIENLGERIDFAELTDLLPDGAELTSGSNVFPISLDAGSSCSIEYKVQASPAGDDTFGSETRSTLERPGADATSSTLPWPKAARSASCRECRT